MTALCHYVWRSFKSVSSGLRYSQNHHKQGMKHPSLTYALGAYLIPLWISFLTWIIKYLDTTSEYPCILSKNEILLSFILPSGIFHALNIFFILATICQLCCGQWANASNINKNEIMEKFFIVLKICFATGIFWTAEVISWVMILLSSGENEDILMKASFPWDILNALSGLTMFVSLNFNKNSLKYLKNSVSNYINEDFCISLGNSKNKMTEDAFEMKTNEELVSFQKFDQEC